jgi:signal transduction histidine kinase
VGSSIDPPDEPAVLLPFPRKGTSVRAFLGAYARSAGALAALVGSIVLAGWVLGAPQLTTCARTWPPMLANTAAASALCGTALLLLTQPMSHRGSRLLGQLFAAGACVLAALTLGEYLTGYDVGLDRILAQTNDAVFDRYPGRPAPQTATTLLLLSASLLLLDRKTRFGFRPAEVLAVLASAIVVIALLGYLFGIEAFYGLPGHHAHNAMAVHTALVLLVLASGILAARPQAGIMSIITAEDLGGTAGRKLLWSLLVLPPVTVALVLGARAGLYSTSFAFALLLFFSLVDGIVVILITAKRLSRLEARITVAQTALAQAHEREGLQRARLEALFDAMPESVIITDGRGNIIQQNHAAENFARSTAQVDPWGNALQYDVRAPNGDPLQPEELPIYRALAKGETVVGAELVIVPPDGKQVPILASATPLLTEHGSAGAIAVYQDIRSLKDLERLREEWAAIVAHDLRQPLGIISLSADLLVRQQDIDIPPQQRKALDRIRSASARLNRMINDLLDASRIEARRLSLGLETVDLGALIEQVVENLKEATVGFALDVSLEPDLFARIDSDRIQQVLENLLGNAAKYGELGTTIGVNAVRHDELVEVTVTNHGPGIPPDQLPKLFSRFARTREARASREAGLGLGLYIARGLVEAHGGRLWAESVPGETTRFHFTVPAAPRPGADRDTDHGQISAVTHCS